MKSIQNYEYIILIFFLIMNFRNLKEKRMKTIHKKNTTFLNLAATALMVVALVLGCNTNVSNGSKVQPEKFTVTFNVNGGNGELTATVDGKAITSPAQVEKGKNLVFTATPHKKYAVDKWSITPSNALIENGKAEDTTAKVKITENTTVNVTFKSTGVQPPTPPVTDGCTVTMSAGANGSITASSVIPAGDKVAKDTEITFTATANTGYRVDTWAITGGAIQAGGQQGDTTAKVKITENTTVNVTFKPIVYTPVAYADLNAYLAAQPASDGIYYIEITGLTAPDVEGYFISDSASPLGQILNSNKRKKVALKFGTMPYVTDMQSCFSGCTSLVQVSNIPDSVTDMRSCFNGCTKLEQIPNIPNSVTNMFNCFKGCTKLEQVPELPDGVTDMQWCFNGCTKLERVPNIPNSITDMAGCFNGCTKLEQIPNIPNSVTDMQWCFNCCTKLEQIPNIPNSVTNMSYCFNDCTSLTSVTLKCGYLDNKFDYAFDGCRRLSAGSIKVPADSLDDYKDNADKMKARAEWFAKDE